MSGEAAFFWSVLIAFLMTLVSWLYNFQWHEPFVIEFIKAILNANTKKISEHDETIALLQKRIEELENRGS